MPMNYNYDICYLTTHGFSVRMIFQTGLLKNLVDRGLRVAIVCPDKEDDNIKCISQRDGVAVYEFSDKADRGVNAIKSIRKYVVEDIRKNPSLWDKHRQVINSGKRNFIKKSRATLGLFINDVVKAFPSLRNLYLHFEKRLLVNTSHLAFIKLISPKILVATYPVTYPEPSLLLAAKKSGIKTVIHLLSWDNITAKGYFQALADKYIAWGPIMEEELIATYGVQAEDIKVCGVPHFDLYFQPPTPLEDHNNLVNELRSSTKSYVFYAMSAPRYAPHEVEIIEFLYKESAKSAGKEEAFTIVARPHPSIYKGSFSDPAIPAKLEELRSSHGLVISTPDLTQRSSMNWSVRDSDMYELVGLLRHAAVVINSGSTVAVEALALGKPVIITAYDADRELPYDQSAKRLVGYTHLQKLVEAGGVVVVESNKELYDQINAFLLKSDRFIAKRNHALSRQIGDQQGNATAKIAAFLQQYVMEE